MIKEPPTQAVKYHAHRLVSIIWITICPFMDQLNERIQIFNMVNLIIHLQL